MPASSKDATIRDRMIEELVGVFKR
jgi:hypothetical protein